jgi:hypothetical protein
MSTSNRNGDSTPAAADELEILKREWCKAQEEIASLKSLRHELQVARSQLQVKATEIGLASYDSAAWLNSSGIAMAFLDAGLRIARFYDPRRRAVGANSDNLGRPFGDLWAGMIGGSLRVQPADGGGTEVICSVPLQ